MFSDAQRNAILETALRVAQSKVVEGAKEAEVVAAAKAVLAAAKAIEGAVGSGGSIIGRITSHAQAEKTPEAA